MPWGSLVPHLFHKRGIDGSTEGRGHIACHTQRWLARAFRPEGSHWVWSILEQGHAKVLRNVFDRHGLVFPRAVSREATRLAIVEDLQNNGQRRVAHNSEIALYPSRARHEAPRPYRAYLLCQNGAQTHDKAALHLANVHRRVEGVAAVQKDVCASNLHLASEHVDLYFGGDHAVTLVREQSLAVGRRPALKQKEGADFVRKGRKAGEL